MRRCNVLVALTVSVFVIFAQAIELSPDVAGDDPKLDGFDDEVPDFSAEDRSELGNNWKLWVSPSRLSGFKMTSVTTSMDRYKEKLADRERSKQTAGMTNETIAHLDPLDCTYSGPYRSWDGSCNNVFYGCWGRSGETYSRLLPPDYGDGAEAPRKGKNGKKLPNVRQLSQLMQGNQIQSAVTASQVFTDLTVHFGQFLAHEISSAAAYTDTVVQDGKLVQVTPSCCDTDNKDSECNEIHVLENDGFFEKGHCIELVRSKFFNTSETACPKNNAISNDIREQVNAVTAFIDAGLIYGSSSIKAEPLIDDDGSMKIDSNSKYIRGGLMPRSDDDTSCQSFYPGCDQRCFKAGDKRASLTPILGALQTLFLREHNRIAARFIAKGWGKWQVYNVTRKIVGAIEQVITYKEYLPLMLGPQVMDKFQLKIPTPNYRYYSSLNPSIINTWASGACRVSHSNIADKLKRESQPLVRCPSLAYDINNMDSYCKPDTDPVRNFLVGACQQKMQDLNTVYSNEITRFLFSTPMKPGKDLRAIDYIRARDHGVPSYNEWRKVCGLKPFGSFEEFKMSISNQYSRLVDQLRVLYQDEFNNVDFGVGAILEPLSSKSTFGPTVTCLFGHQFHRLKFGDRFWFENPRVPTAFSTDQLNRLQKITLAGLICANTDVARIQRNVFLVASKTNPTVSCKVLLSEQDLNIDSYRF